MVSCSKQCDSGYQKLSLSLSLTSSIILSKNDGSALWHSLGCPKHKLIVGMAFYGRTYTLSSRYINKLHAPIRNSDTNGGKPGRFTNESGFISYFEFCQEEQTWTKDYDAIGQCPYAYKADQWFGYEDARSLEIKMDWLRDNNYGGAMFWALDLDDYRGACGERDVLFNTLVRGLQGYSVNVSQRNLLASKKKKPGDWWTSPLAKPSRFKQNSIIKTKRKQTQATQLTNAQPKTAQIGPISQERFTNGDYARRIIFVPHQFVGRSYNRVVPVENAIFPLGQPIEWF